MDSAPPGCLGERRNYETAAVLMKLHMYDGTFLAFDLCLEPKLGPVEVNEHFDVDFNGLGFVCLLRF